MLLLGVVNVNTLTNIDFTSLCSQVEYKFYKTAFDQTQTLFRVKVSTQIRNRKTEININGRTISEKGDPIPSKFGRPFLVLQSCLLSLKSSQALKSKRQYKSYFKHK